MPAGSTLYADRRLPVGQIGSYLGGIRYTQQEMTRRQWLAGAAAPAFLQGQGRKRNLVFILSDDHRFDAMGFTGHPWVKTPNLDRLASGGLHFRNAFVTTALCSPSRASVLTGQYGHAHGVLDNITALPKTLPTFPQVLQQHGYRTALMGKWHMGGDTDEKQPGFDNWISFRGQGRYNDAVLNFNGQRREMKGYVTDILTEEAVKFIRGNRSRPFMLYLGHKAVHSEFFPAERHKNLYSSDPIPYPATMANTEETYRGKPDWVRRQRNSWHGVDGMYDKKVNFDQFYRDYMRCVTSLDESVGSVYHVLPEGLLELEEGVLEEKAKAAVLLIRLEESEIKSEKQRDWGYQGIVAHSKICTHVGCPVGLYEQTTHHLLCPCHQSTFDVTQDCKVIFGPAKRPLPQLKITVDDEGYLVSEQPFAEAVGPSYWERGRA